MLYRWSKFSIPAERITLRLPRHEDHLPWVSLRKDSTDFLAPWEPDWARDHFTRRAFSNRVTWARRTFAEGKGLPMFLERRADGVLLGAITLDHIRRGPAQTGTLGYWIGREFARQGYMSEAILAITHYAFTHMDLSRIEAACLPENAASRGLLEKSGFKYEGVAQSYLQIAGRWRNHVLYAALRSDRRGKTDAS